MLRDRILALWLRRQRWWPKVVQAFVILAEYCRTGEIPPFWR